MRLSTTTSSSSPRSRLRLLVGLTMGVVLLGLAGVGVYGLVNPPPDPIPVPSAYPPSSPVPGPSPTPQSGTDPVLFAQTIAHTLFNWDTRTDTPERIRDQVLAWADPTGRETPGLITDIAGYLPDSGMWAVLRGYETTQHLEITSAAVPDSWAQITRSAAPDQIPPGATAVTVTGIRHRDGVTFGQPSSVERDVSFTIFLTCPTTSTGSCHVLRLSSLDTPLD